MRERCWEQKNFNVARRRRSLHQIRVNVKRPREKLIIKLTKNVQKLVLHTCCWFTFCPKLEARKSHAESRNTWKLSLIKTINFWLFNNADAEALGSFACFFVSTSIDRCARRKMWKDFYSPHLDRKNDESHDCIGEELAVDISLLVSGPNDDWSLI